MFIEAKKLGACFPSIKAFVLAGTALAIETRADKRRIEGTAKCILITTRVGISLEGENNDNILVVVNYAESGSYSTVIYRSYISVETFESVVVVLYLML